MRAAALAVVLLLSGAAYAAGEGCGVCHGAERVLHAKSVHAGADLGCVDCHGGDPNVLDSKARAHSVEAGYRGRVSRPDTAHVCGGCHSDLRRMRPYGLHIDQLAAYETSHHGQAMLQKGQEDAATCTDCHSVHDVLAVSDPRSPAHRNNVPATCGSCHADQALMERHGLSTDAPAAYANSVHGLRLAEGAPGVPTCASCHDAHAAAPPGATEVADVCGSCHRDAREHFRESPHLAASERGAMKQCITCHGNHSVAQPRYELFDKSGDDDDDEDGVPCLACHRPDDPEDRGAQVALAFGRDFRETSARLHKAVARVESVGADGFYVDDERETIARARRELIRAVPLTHTVDVHRVEAALRHAGSLIDDALLACDGKVIETRDRRIYGSAGALVLLGIAAFLMLRRRRYGTP